MRWAIAALTLGAAALLAPAASAAAMSSYEGGCGFDSMTDPMNETAAERMSGVIYAAVAVHSGTVTDNPVSATVTCELKVNGITKGTLTATGTALITGVEDTWFYATDADVVAMCETVDYTSDDTPTTTNCGDSAPTQIPPQEVIDFIDALIDLVIDLVRECCPGIDLDVCLYTSLLGATGLVDVPGVLTINAQGDVFLLGEPFWDCPPYELSPPS